MVHLRGMMSKRGGGGMSAMGPIPLAAEPITPPAPATPASPVADEGKMPSPLPGKRRRKTMKKRMPFQSSSFRESGREPGMEQKRPAAQKRMPPKRY